MRRRGGRSSSAGHSVCEEQGRMALRKQAIKMMDASDVPSGSQQVNENTQEDEALDNNDELSSSLLSPSSSREKRKRERDKSKPKEMTEEEMMDLALRLSEQEASITALRLQKEEEAVMKAIQESMVSQTQLCLPSQSQSLLTDAEAPLRICSRRKLLYSNGKPVSDQGGSEDSCTTETNVNRGTKRSGYKNNNRNKRQKKKEGSPLLEMPDLSQTQQVYSQASPSSSEIVDLCLDSPQSCDSTQIDDCQLHKSPVFPSTGCRAEVHVPRLSQDLLQTCKTSGFVLCSQDNCTLAQKSPLTQPKSPRSPKSLEPSSNLALSKRTTFPQSPVSSETDQGDDGETEVCLEYFKSPVFGQNTQREKSPSACKPQVSDCNSGFMFSTQDSLTSSVKSTSCRPKSPVFPRSASPPKSFPTPERSATCKSPVFSETDGGQTEQGHEHRTSPVFGRTGRRQKICLGSQKHSASPSAAELKCSSSDRNSAATGGHSLILRQDSETDHNQDIMLKESSESDDAEKLKEISKERDSAEMELTSDMTLLWSDEEDDVTPVGSPSPVFPEERPVHQAASLNHVTAASPGLNCRPSSTSIDRQQLSNTEQEPRPIGSQGSVSRASAPPVEHAGGSMVHYYWGVPFCPRGLDPDEYTQVILAQMEVYEKSLKQAQRCLLRKAEWGEAILPQPEKSPSPESPAESPQPLFPQRRGLRLRGKKLCDGDDTPLAEAEEEEDKRDKEEEEERENKEEEKNEGEEQVDVDDCEVCPETQLSDNDNDRTQDLMLDSDAGAQLRPKSPELPEVEMILRDGSPSGNQLREEEMEVDVPVDRRTEGDVPVSSSDVGPQTVSNKEMEEDREDPDVKEDRGLQRSLSPELEAAVVPQIPEASVDCPICQGSFPVTEIEMHAAYCDGEVAVVDEWRPKVDCFQVSSRTRRKRTRGADVNAEETNDSSNTGKNQHKCYVCQKAVPMRDYSRHTELCIQRQSSKTAAKGNLLSALEKTESRDSEAGPSGSKLQPRDVIDLRDDDDDEEEDEEEGSVSAIKISNSPIRSFTPISEATDCLIDFKKQQRPKKLSQRRR